MNNKRIRGFEKISKRQFEEDFKNLNKKRIKEKKK